MTSRHDDMNTGFEDVVDFREPEMRNDWGTCSHNTDEKTFAHESSSLLKRIFLNNLQALFVHLIVLLLGIIPALITALVFADSEGAFLVFLGLSFLGGLFVYTFLAYRLLKPLPKLNFLSVAVLIVPLLMAGTMVLLLNVASVEAAALIESPAYIFLMFFNAWYNIVAIIMLSFIQSNGYISYEFMINTAFIVSPIPLACTYLGLRIKIWRQKRGQ